MAAYVVVDIDVTDPVGYEEYKNLAGPAVVACGGKYLARGGATTTLEGDWHPSRLVILQFDSVEQAKRWWESPEYCDAKAIRQRTAHTQMVVVEGV